MNYLLAVLFQTGPFVCCVCSRFHLSRAETMLWSLEAEYGERNNSICHSLSFYSAHHVRTRELLQSRGGCLWRGAEGNDCAGSRDSCGAACSRAAAAYGQGWGPKPLHTSGYIISRGLGCPGIPAWDVGVSPPEVSQPCVLWGSEGAACEQLH